MSKDPFIIRWDGEEQVTIEVADMTLGEVADLIGHCLVRIVAHAAPSLGEESQQELLADMLAEVGTAAAARHRETQADVCLSPDQLN